MKKEIRPDSLHIYTNFFLCVVFALLLVSNCN